MQYNYDDKYNNHSYRFNIKKEEGKYPINFRNKSLKSKSICCEQFLKNKSPITDNEYEVTCEIEKER